MRASYISRNDYNDYWLKVELLEWNFHLSRFGSPSPPHSPLQSSLLPPPAVALIIIDRGVSYARTKDVERAVRWGAALLERGSRAEKVEPDCATDGSGVQYARTHRQTVPRKVPPSHPGTTTTSTQPSSVRPGHPRRSTPSTNFTTNWATSGRLSRSDLLEGSWSLIQVWQLCKKPLLFQTQESSTAAQQTGHWAFPTWLPGDQNLFALQNTRNRGKPFQD